MVQGKTRIAIYDMDKTVTRRATYNGFLWHMVKHRAPWRMILFPLLPIGLIFYGLKVWDRKRLKQFSQSLFMGRRIDPIQLSPHLESYADHVIAHNVYQQLIDRMAQEKSEGYRHVMATASYRLYVSAIAQKLGFDDVIATDLETDVQGNILAKIDGENCYDTAKLVKIEEWMTAQNLAREECHIRGYSDHVSDAPLLGYSDEAYATNPHPPLSHKAKQEGWQIIDWRN